MSDDPGSSIPQPSFAASDSDAPQPVMHLSASHATAPQPVGVQGVPRNRMSNLARQSESARGERFLEVPVNPELYAGVRTPAIVAQASLCTVVPTSHAALPVRIGRVGLCMCDCAYVFGWVCAVQGVEEDVTTVLRYTPSHVKYRAPPDRFGLHQKIRFVLIDRFIRLTQHTLWSLLPVWCLLCALYHPHSVVVDRCQRRDCVFVPFLLCGAG